MIKTENLTKQFDTTTALDCLSTTIEEGRIYGLVGSNGAGKSTLLRLLAGVYRPTSGSVEIDGEPVFENPALKQKIFFIPDELYQMPGASLASLANIYRALYHSWSDERYQELVGRFPIPPERKLSACSKGMRRQIAIILALSCQPKYLLLDEAFDGLDPVMRQAVKSLFAADMADRNLTPIIASHNLRELEDICDHVGLLHRGGILFSRDLDDMKLGMYKMQCIFPNPLPDSAWEGFDILHKEQRGSLYTITARGSREELLARVNALNPTFCEMLPLTLEEIFINETEVAGYDVKKLLF